MSDRNQHIDQQTLEKYLSGRLNSKEQYEVERVLQASPFEEEAAEGFESVPVGDWHKDLKVLQRNVDNFHRTNRKFTWYTWAAGVALVLVSGFAVWLVLQQDPQESELATVSEETETTVDQDTSQTASSKPDGTLQEDTESQLALNESTDPSIEDDINSESIQSGETGTTTQEEPISQEPDIDFDQVADNTETLDAITGTQGDALALNEAEEISEEAEDESADDMAAITTTEPTTTQPIAQSGGARDTPNKSRKAGETGIEDIADVDVTVAEVETEQPEENTTAGVTRSTFGSSEPKKAVSDAVYSKYVTENLQYPAAAIEAKVEGSVKVIFSVNPDGSLSDFIVLQGIGFGCDEEAIRLIQNGPKWEPATSNGSPIKADGFQEIQFSLEKK